jgi:hypothetical protein
MELQTPVLLTGVDNINFRTSRCIPQPSNQDM